MAGPLVTAVATLLRKGPASFTGWVVRDGQLRYASYVARMLLSETGDRLAFAHAGVGIGKTLGYLLPALTVYRRDLPGPIVVSTHTLALMSQLHERDVPTAREWLNMTDLPILLAKGTPQFLCYYRLRGNDSTGETSLVSQIVDAIRVVFETGQAELADIDRATLQMRLGHIPEDAWGKIRVDPCLGVTCPWHQVCPYPRYRETRRTMERGLIITNHALLANDLGRRFQGKTGLWPTPSAIIVDEADRLEESLRQELAARLTPQECREAARLIGRQGRILRQVDVRDLRSLLEVLGSTLRDTVRRSQRLADPDAIRQPVVASEKFLRVLARTALLADRALNALQMTMAIGDEGADRLTDLLTAIVECHRQYRHAVNDAAYVAWVEGGAIFAGPTNVGAALKPVASRAPLILTSGTLAPSGDFTILRHVYQVPRAPTFHVPSPFPYEQLMRYVLVTPEDGVLPSSAERFRNLANRGPLYDSWMRVLTHLLTAAGGRALVLFTSKADLTAVYQRLGALRLPFRVLAEHTGAIGDLIETFCADETSVLLSTSAWQGLDVPGRALTLVLVTKLPYPVPSDPLFVAQRKQLESRQLIPKGEFATRWMLYRLAQGVGRLIRREDDRGVVAMLDQRARERWGMIQSVLPKAPVSTVPEGIAFLQQLVGSQQPLLRGSIPFGPATNPATDA